MKVLAIIFDGFEEEEAVAPFALLKKTMWSFCACGARFASMWKPRLMIAAS